MVGGEISEFPEVCHIGVKFPIVEATSQSVGVSWMNEGKSFSEIDRHYQKL